MNTRRSVAVILVAVAGAVAQQTTVYKGKEEKLPVVVAPQPVRFSHKQHAALGVKCLDCHKTAAKEDQAGLPSVQQCLVCHRTLKSDSPEIQKLAELQRSKERIKWVRVYKVPDFVFFSHASHVKAGEQCAACHGPVQEREVLAQEVSTSMVSCMNCHAARKASNECVLCHQLSF